MTSPKPEIPPPDVEEIIDRKWCLDTQAKIRSIAFKWKELGIGWMECVDKTRDFKIIVRGWRVRPDIAEGATLQ